MRAATTLLALSVLMACRDSTHEAAARAEVQEIALRWAFSAADTDLQPAAYCLGIDADAAMLGDGNPADPPAEFLTRFSDIAVPVRPISECRVEGNSRHAVIDAATGRFGLAFLFSPVTAREPGTFVIEVGYMQGGHWGAGWECTVRQASFGWSSPDCRRIVDI